MKLCVSDALTVTGDCGDVILTRTFTVSDKQGNYSGDSPCDGPVNRTQCEQIMTFKRTASEDILLPPRKVFLELTDSFEEDDNGNPAPEVTGWPSVRSAFGLHLLDATYCNVGASYSDFPSVFICGNAYKILREWHVFDWCTPGDYTQYHQIIQVGGDAALSLECPNPEEVVTY